MRPSYPKHRERSYEEYFFFTANAFVSVPLKGLKAPYVLGGERSFSSSLPSPFGLSVHLILN